MKHVVGGKGSIFSKEQEIETFGENKYKYLPVDDKERGNLFQESGRGNNVGCWAEGQLKGDFEPTLIWNNFWHYRKAKQCFIVNVKALLLILGK